MDFFAEFEKLKLKMPRVGVVRVKNINSDYTAFTDQLKNCYLIANAVNDENCMYGRDLYDNIDCVDCDHILKCTLCYECVNCRNCYDSAYLQDCENSNDCAYGYDLKGCANCIGCAGLRKKEYHIFNEPYSKEAFFEKKKLLTSQEIQDAFAALKLKVPRQYAIIVNSENSFGNSIYNCKNAWCAFDAIECQDVGYIEESKYIKDSYDTAMLENAELCYEISSSHILNNCNFCFGCISSRDLQYCEYVMNSTNCFGCVSLNHKQYHILNNTYSKEDYFKKVAEIKDEVTFKRHLGKWPVTSTYPLEDTVASWPRI